MNKSSLGKSYVSLSIYGFTVAKSETRNCELEISIDFHVPTITLA